MKQLIQIIFLIITLNLNALTLDEINTLMLTKKMSVYGAKSSDKNGSNGIGLFYNTQNLKVKIEGSDSAFKTGALIQTNPFRNPLYVSFGGNYINEQIDTSGTNRDQFDQYSGAFAIGYSLKNNLYVEAGKNVSKLNALQTYENFPSNGSVNKETFVQLGKRFETPIGTIDTQMKGNQIYNTLSTKEQNYENSVHYYLNDAVKLGYAHSTNQNDIVNAYSLDLGYFSTQYTKDITKDTYNLTLGVKANFSDITDLSTYKTTSKVKKNLSKSQKLDNIILQKNMQLRK